MTKILGKIGIVFTALLLIAASGGYSIYQHYCECLEMMTTSVFLDVECAHDRDAAETHTCCSNKDYHMSCCSSGNDDTDNHNCHSGECCQTNIQFLKINDSYTAWKDNTTFYVIDITSMLSDGEDLSIQDNHVKAKQYFSDSSPPLSGRKLLLEIHQLKIAPELV
jgi:hypothetical protein